MVRGSRLRLRTSLLLALVDATVWEVSGVMGVSGGGSAKSVRVQVQREVNRARASLMVKMAVVLVVSFFLTSALTEGAPSVSESGSAFPGCAVVHRDEKNPPLSGSVLSAMVGSLSEERVGRGT